MANFTATILNNISRGRKLASELNVEYIKCLRQDAPYKYKHTYMSLVRILKAINFKLIKDQFDEIANLLYRQLLLLLGEKSITKVIEWGYYSALPNPASIIFQFSKSIPSGATEYIMDFSGAVLSSDKFVAWSEPISEQAKTKWFNTTLNNGTIPDSAFSSSVIVGDKRITISRAIFVFDSTNTTLKISLS